MTMTEHRASPSATAAEMQAFITAVLGDQRGNAVLALVGGRHEDGKPIINRPTWFAYPAELDAMVRFATAHAQEDVYLSPLIYGEKRDSRNRLKRDKDNARSSQTIYLDSDSCPPEKFRLRPSIHVTTSPGHGHDYWLLPAPIPAADAAEIAHRITTAHKADGSDANGWSANKFLRLPTVNLSYGEPFPITWEHTGEVYNDLDISGAYGDVDTSPTAPAGAERAPEAAPSPGVRPEVMDKRDLAPLYDRIPASNLKLIDLLDHEPKAGEKGWRSEQRWALLLELCRAGFEDREAMSIAWHAAASGKWWDDPRGIDGLWYELQKARVQVDQESGRHITPAERTATQKHSGPVVIKPAERAAIAQRPTFIDQYVQWAASRVPVLNRPLHTINAWTILSTFYAEVGGVWKPTGPLPVNLYSISIARSSTGKSEASRLMNRAITTMFSHDPVHIGADHSRNAFVEQLLERDGMVALANSDEADETIRTQRDAPWAQGMQQAWTEVYDGEVPQQGRIGKKDLRKPNAKARVVSHFVGTPEGMFDVLDRSMFKSGYMVRQVWVRGMNIPITAESIKLARRSRKVAAVDASLLPRYWAHRTTRNRMRLMGPAIVETEVVFTDEAYDRLDAARWAVISGLEKFGDHEVYGPMGNRMLDIMLKACALLAMSEGRDYVTLNDTLIALAHVQDWLDTAVEVVNSIAASAFSRACDEIEAFVAGREGREAEASRIFTLMKGVRPRDVEEYLQSLVSQGRLESIQPKAGGPRRYKIKGEMPS